MGLGPAELQDSYPKLLPLVIKYPNRDITRMLTIDLTGKRALVAGVADDAGFGFAIAKALAEAGASVSVGTWPPALNIFMNLLERGKMDESRMLSGGQVLKFEKIYPLDAAYDVLTDAPEDIRTNKRYKVVMKQNTVPPKQPPDTPEARHDELLRRALATPPISNETILKRSKESHRK